MQLTGRCTCGAVAYALGARPLFVHCCHCSWCQRETGSAFVLNALIEARLVEVTSGAPVEILTRSASGKGQRITRCPDCHVALWSVYYGMGPRFRFVRAGTLDDPAQCPPEVHIFTGTRQPWVHLDGSVPVFEEYYDRAEIWPEESLRRLQAERCRAE